MLSFFVEHKILILIWLCFFLHLIVDYLTGTTVPFFPFSKFKMISPFQKLKRKYRILIEIIITTSLAILFILKVM